MLLHHRLEMIPAVVEQWAYPQMFCCRVASLTVTAAEFRLTDSEVGKQVVIQMMVARA